MVTLAAPSTPRVVVHAGRRSLATRCLLLRGDRVYVLSPPSMPRTRRARVDLEWGHGQTTRLPVRLLADDGSVLVGLVERVEGDWRPFLAYLGDHAS